MYKFPAFSESTLLSYFKYESFKTKNFKQYKQAEKLKGRSEAWLCG